MIAIITSFSDLLPGFSANAEKLRLELMVVGAFICAIGVALKALTNLNNFAVLMTLVRLTIVVSLISQIKPIGNDIIDIVNGVTTQSGFDIKRNVLADFQTALATKFSNMGSQPGNSNPWQFLMGIAEAPGIVILGTMVYFLSIVAATVMFFMSGMQQLLLALEVATSPLWLSCFMIPALTPLATKNSTFFVSLCCWSLGFRVLDMIIQGILDFAINTTNNAAIGGVNAIGGSFGWFIAIMLLGGLGYPLSAWITSKAIVTEGNHGMRSLFPAMAGWAMGAAAQFGMPSSPVGAVSAASRIAGGGGVSLASPMPYRNYATRTP
jgi:hypothetical protein